jgi:hypothetical protein
MPILLVITQLGILHWNSIHKYISIYRYK